MQKAFEKTVLDIYNSYVPPVFEAKVKSCYSENGKIYVDCIILDTNGKEGSKVIPFCEIPLIFSVGSGGILAYLEIGTRVLINFVENDFSRPFISAVLGKDKSSRTFSKNQVLLKTEKAELQLGKNKIVLKNETQSLKNLIDSLLDTISSAATIDGKTLDTGTISKITALKTDFEELFDE